MDISSVSNSIRSVSSFKSNTTRFIQPLYIGLLEVAAATVINQMGTKWKTRELISIQEAF